MIIVFETGQALHGNFTNSKEKSWHNEIYTIAVTDELRRVELFSRFGPQN